MSLYVRLYTSFFTHRKTHRLRAAIGDDALWVPPRIWAYAATNQPDGDFKDYSAEDIAYGIGYSKDAQALLQALLQAGFMDADMKLHNWSEHSGFHELYASRAKKAAEVRWSKEREKKEAESELSGAELKKHCLTNASSIAQASGSNGNGSPHLEKKGRKYVREIKIQLEEAEQEITWLKEFGTTDAHREKLKLLSQRKKELKAELLAV